MLPNTQCNPFQTVLEAGRLRAEASRLEDRANLLEAAARESLQHDEIASNITLRMPGSTLIVAHGGEASGLVLFLPVESLKDRTMLATKPKSSSDFNPLEPVPMAAYSPALMIGMGQGMLASAVLVPTGTVRDFQRDIARSRTGAAAEAIAKAVLLGVGFNAEAAFGVVKMVHETFAQQVEASEVAMVVQLGMG